MIDLHMHSTYSDGSESCTSILKKCQEKKLDYISITDHNTALAYEELEKINIKDFYSGKIIQHIIRIKYKSFKYSYRNTRLWNRLQKNKYVGRENIYFY